MEEISGPVSGFYIATYACSVGELGSEYLGYARVFRFRPRSFWDGQAVFEWVAVRISDSASAAHSMAHEAASEYIARSLS
jgi:hypothetical protein